MIANVFGDQAVPDDGHVDHTTSPDHGHPIDTLRKGLDRFVSLLCTGDEDRLFDGGSR